MSILNFHISLAHFYKKYYRRYRRLCSVLEKWKKIVNKMKKKKHNPQLTLF